MGGRNDVGSNAASRQQGQPRQRRSGLVRLRLLTFGNGRAALVSPFSPLPGEAVRYRADKHAIVNLRRQLRTLRGIERDLAGSDPGLDAMFRSFARRTGGPGVPRVEKIDRRRFWVLGRRRRQRSLTDRMKDWTAENWNDP
jgi:hypothetical protein